MQGARIFPAPTPGLDSSAARFNPSVKLRFDTGAVARWRNGLPPVSGSALTSDWRARLEAIMALPGAQREEREARERERAAAEGQHGGKEEGRGGGGGGGGAAAAAPEAIACDAARRRQWKIRQCLHCARVRPRALHSLAHALPQKSQGCQRPAQREGLVQPPRLGGRGAQRSGDGRQCQLPLLARAARSGGSRRPSLPNSQPARAREECEETARKTEAVLGTLGASPALGASGSPAPLLAGTF